MSVRYYDPATGQWLSADPQGLDSGDANLYRYVQNNPVNATDPSGEDSTVTIGWSDPTKVYWNVQSPSAWFYSTVASHEIGRYDAKTGMVTLRAPYANGEMISLKQLQADVLRNKANLSGFSFVDQQGMISAYLHGYVERVAAKRPESPLTAASRQFAERTGRPGAGSFYKWVYTGDPWANEEVYRAAGKGTVAPMARNYPAAYRSLEALSVVELGKRNAPLATATAMVLKYLMGEAHEAAMRGELAEDQQGKAGEQGAAFLEALEKHAVPAIQIIGALEGAEKPEELIRAWSQVADVVLEGAIQEAKKQGDLRAVEGLEKIRELNARLRMAADRDLVGILREGGQQLQALLEAELKDPRLGPGQRAVLEDVKAVVDALLLLDQILAGVAADPHKVQAALQAIHAVLVAVQRWLAGHGQVAFAQRMQPLVNQAQKAGANELLAVVLALTIFLVGMVFEPEEEEEEEPELPAELEATLADEERFREVPIRKGFPPGVIKAGQVPGEADWKMKPRELQFATSLLEHGARVWRTQGGKERGDFVVFYKGRIWMIEVGGGKTERPRQVTEALMRKELGKDAQRFGDDYGPALERILEGS